MAIVVQVPGSKDANLNKAFGGMAQSFMQMYAMGSQLQDAKAKRDLTKAQLGKVQAETAQLDKYAGPMSPASIAALSGEVATAYGFVDADPATAVANARLALGTQFDTAVQNRWRMGSTTASIRESGNLGYNAGISTYVRREAGVLSDQLTTLISDPDVKASAQEWGKEMRTAIAQADKSGDIAAVKAIRIKFEDAGRYEADRPRVIKKLEKLKADDVISDKIEELTGWAMDARVLPGGSALAEQYRKEMLKIDDIQADIETGYGTSPAALLRNLQILLDQTSAEIKANFTQRAVAGQQAQEMLAMAPPGTEDMSGVRAASPMLADEMMGSGGAAGTGSAGGAPAGGQGGEGEWMRRQLEESGMSDEMKATYKQASDLGLLESGQRYPSAPKRQDFTEQTGIQSMSDEGRPRAQTVGGKEGYSMAGRSGERHFVAPPEDFRSVYNSIAAQIGHRPLEAMRGTQSEAYRLLDLSKRRGNRGAMSMNEVEFAMSEVAQEVVHVLDTAKDEIRLKSDGKGATTEQQNAAGDKAMATLKAIVGKALDKDPEEVTDSEIKTLYAMHPFYRELKGEDRSKLQRSFQSIEGDSPESRSLNMMMNPVRGMAEQQGTMSGWEGALPPSLGGVDWSKNHRTIDSRRNRSGVDWEAHSMMGDLRLIRKKIGEQFGYRSTPPGEAKRIRGGTPLSRRGFSSQVGPY